MRKVIQMEEKELSILLIKEGKWWTARCLEFDVAVQSEFYHDLQSKFVEAFLATVDAYETEGVDWRKGIRRAPEKYWAMFEKAVPIEFYIDETVKNLLQDFDKPTGRFVDINPAEKELACA